MTLELDRVRALAAAERARTDPLTEREREGYFATRCDVAAMLAFMHEAKREIDSAQKEGDRSSEGDRNE